MPDRFQGDPLLILTDDGSDMVFPGDGGQPLMDQGLENSVNISLFTEPGWVGNVLFEPNEQIGAGYEAAGRQPITLTNINNLQNTAELALKWMIDERMASKITAKTTNSEGTLRTTTILIEPPGADIQEVILTKYGENWINQTVDPAYRKI